MTPLVLLQLTSLQLQPADVTSGHFKNMHVVPVRFEVGKSGEALRAPFKGTLDGAAGALVQLRVLLEALQALQHLAAHIAQVRNSFFLTPGTFCKGFSLCGEVGGD